MLLQRRQTWGKKGISDNSGKDAVGEAQITGDSDVVDKKGKGRSDNQGQRRYVLSFYLVIMADALHTLPGTSDWLAYHHLFNTFVMRLAYLVSLGTPWEPVGKPSQLNGFVPRPHLQSQATRNLHSMRYASPTFRRAGRTGCGQRYSGLTPNQHRRCLERTSPSTVMSEVWAHPGKTGVIGLLLCLYWQAEYSGAGNDWNDNVKCIDSIFDAILAIPEL